MRFLKNCARNKKAGPLAQGMVKDVREWDVIL
jgi:hypothetical protein